MNYRRGLQRVYAVLTVAWITFVFLTILPGRWEPWTNWDVWVNRGWSFADGKQGMASLDDIVAVPTPAGQPQQYEIDLSKLRDTPPPKPTVSIEEFLSHERTKRKLTWAVGLSLLSPLVPYVLLFYILPWVYRGFRSTSPAKD
jgi:hypothetical protein